MAKGSGGSSGVLEDYAWERLPDMPTPRCYSVAAYHDGNIYVMGESRVNAHNVNQCSTGIRTCACS